MVVVVDVAVAAVVCAAVVRAAAQAVPRMIMVLCRQTQAILDRLPVPVIAELVC